MIEDLTRDNIAEAIDLVRIVFPTDVPAPGECLLASVYPDDFRLDKTVHQTSDLRFWVYVVDKKIVGIVGRYTMNWDLLISDWIGYMAVRSDRRRNGIGTDLLNFVLTEMRQRHKRFARVFTGLDSFEATGLYHGHGFYDTGRGVSLNGEQLIYLEKKIR